MVVLYSVTDLPACYLVVYLNSGLAIILEGVVLALLLFLCPLLFKYAEYRPSSSSQRLKIKPNY